MIYSVAIMTPTNLVKSLLTDNLSQDKSFISSLIDYIPIKISKMSIGNFKQGIIPAIALKRKPWWVEVTTTSPLCLYYFGPFETITQAMVDRDGYIEDLVEEKACGITVVLKQDLPSNLTVFAESEPASP